MSPRFALTTVLALSAAGCWDGPLESGEPIAELEQPVKPLTVAPCTIMVKGVGIKDLEGEYLPRVVMCENGGADIEALKAQAISARSVAYYAIKRNGQICDGSGCQVMTCGNQPTLKVKKAVAETAGMFLSYSDVLTYGFYLNGDKQTSDPPSCEGDPGGYNEKYITYNWGLTGTDVAQTPLGSIQSPSESLYGQNRGCMSQWGARCLEAYKGFDYAKILQFYYGMDIEIRTAAVNCTAADAASDALIDVNGDAQTDAGASDAGDDGGSNAGDDGGSDGGESDDGSGDAAADGNPTVPPGATNDSGSCSLSGSPQSGWLTLALCVIPLAMVRRRRSRTPTY
jgi:hypothetical protein